MPRKLKKIKKYVTRNHEIDRFYEIIFIIHPELVVNKKEGTIIDKYVDMFKTIEHKEEMGLRNLAYPIKKQITGFYFFMHVVAKLDDIRKFESIIKLDSNIIRYMVIRHKYSYAKLVELATPKLSEKAAQKHFANTFQRKSAYVNKLDNLDKKTEDVKKEESDASLEKTKDKVEASKNEKVEKVDATNEDNAEKKLEAADKDKTVE